MNGMIMVLVVGVLALDLFGLTGLIHLRSALEGTRRHSKKRNLRRKSAKGYFDLSVTDLKRTVPAAKKTTARTKKTAPAAAPAVSISEGVK